MSMQLFSFGHPCEHQLRRTCIGGSSCPLNGYPDIWCCSYIKGKINFKRDKPCEGPRCRWGFTHPTQQQFDAVTQVLSESRPIAVKIDEADDKDLLTFHVDNPHIVDTVQCALHMMRRPPSSCARRVGQLLACAAVRSGDAKIFMQLLKTMKKPVDSYILGAYAYLTQGSLPTPPAHKEGGGKAKKGDKNAGAAKKEDVVEELKNDMVDLMNAALSQGGHLVDREDQHVLQATFLHALRQYPRSNKRRQEMLENAVAKFGNRKATKDSTSAAPTATAAAAAATPPTAADSAAAAAESATAPAAVTPTPTPTAAAAAAAAAAATTTVAPTAAAATPATPAATPTAAAAVAASTAVQTPATTPKTTSTAEPPATSTPAPAAALPPSQPSPTAAAAGPAATAAAVATTPKQSLPTPSEGTAVSPVSQPAASHNPTAAAAPAPAAAARPTAGISRVVAARAAAAVPSACAHNYSPLRTDEPLPDVFLLGGLFSLLACSAYRAPLGAFDGTSAPLPPPQSQSQSQSAQQPSLAKDFAVGSETPLASAFLSAPAAPAEGNRNLFLENFFSSLSTDQVFSNLDANQILKDLDERWTA